MRVVGDIEATDLLNDNSIDYTASPYKLKDSFSVHCVVFKDIDTGQIYEFVQEEIKKNVPKFLSNVTEMHWHNGISYDLLALKLLLGLDYSVASEVYAGNPCEINDTLILSKVLNPDRDGHSLDAWGERLGFPKVDWRAEAVSLGLIEPNAPRGAEFKQYHPRMLDYCKNDVELTDRVRIELAKEWGNWDWESAYKLELAVAEIVSRQEHRGFNFNSELAKKYVVDLDNKMSEIRTIVEPLIPAKPMGATAQKLYMPPAKQFKLDGTFSTHMSNFLEKHKATDISFNGATIYGQQWKFPLESGKPLVDKEPANIEDTTHLKGWLVSLGWNPSAWKERDLTIDTKKRKLTQEQYEAAVERYVKQTANSPFQAARFDHLNVQSVEQMRAVLLEANTKKPVRVLTNPQLTVGQDKELCPGLAALGNKFEHARKVADYLTYRHRRNSILGGGVDPDDLEEEPEKGYLANVRADGRIPTPADTCGCNTSRFKHRIVCNIPRSTSLYGKEMRSLFGVGKGKLQLGYDGDGLEARIEAHYTHKYPGGPEYGVALVAPKPNDIHTTTAKTISEIIEKDFSRIDAKTTKYAVTYGAQPPKLAKQNGWTMDIAQKVFEGFWIAAKPLALLKEALERYWQTTGQKKFILGLDGRKVPTRSKHALLNALFQSAGLICMKRAMVIHDRNMRAEGYTIDFFTQDWLNTPYAQQMQAYHDEGQLELSKEYVKFKTFDTEEEAVLFNVNGKILSDVGHSPSGKYFRAYSRVGELAALAVNEAGKYYKLNVELTSGYTIGLSWKDCH